MQGDREGVVAVERPASPRIDPVVFWTAAVLSAVFVAWGILFTDNLAAVFNAVLFNFLVPNFGWVFILATFGFLVFSLYLAFSRYGRIRLGDQEEQPEFRTVSWVAMMFSAGMGIGLMFYGVAEPIYHFGRPAARPGQGQHQGCRPGGHGVLLLPLGVSPVGHVGCARVSRRLLHLPQGYAQPDQHGVLPDLG